MKCCFLSRSFSDLLTNNCSYSCLTTSFFLISKDPSKSPVHVKFRDVDQLQTTQTHLYPKHHRTLLTHVSESSESESVSCSAVSYSWTADELPLPWNIPEVNCHALLQGISANSLGVLGLLSIYSTLRHKGSVKTLYLCMLKLDPRT